MSDQSLNRASNLILAMGGVIIALLSAVLGVMWVRTDDLRATDRELIDRISAVEGSQRAVLESLQHDGE